MIKVKNSRIINKLVIRILKNSKMRNIIAMLAIIMTTVLFTGMFSLGSGMLESFQNQSLRLSGGKGHISFKYISDEQFNKLKNHPSIDGISYNKIIAETVDNPEFLKRKVELYYLDDKGMDYTFIDITEGKKPEKENEIAMDSKSLELLGAEKRIGEEVKISYTAYNEKVEKTFVLSGYWESDSIQSVGFAMVSEAYMKKVDRVTNENRLQAGRINAYAILKDGKNLEESAIKIIIESGYKVADDSGREEEKIIYGVNWAYLSSNFSKVDMSLIIGAIGGIILIMLTGYLIIYNIFQISVVKDIKLFGLFKTIGITSKQIRKIVLRQGIFLWVASFPIGAVIGFIIGRLILPIIMEITTVSTPSMSLNPLIFVLAAVFSLMTVLISVRKPGRIAGKISPVEALRFNGSRDVKKKNKKSYNGNKMWRLALSNVGRNKKRTVTAVVSMALSLVLLNSTYSLTNGFSMDKFLSKFAGVDFLVGNAEYFNNQFRFYEQGLSEDIIEKIQQMEGHKDGGRLYFNINRWKCTIVRNEEDELNAFGDGVSKGEDGNPMVDLYGMDDFILNNVEFVDGEVNKEKLESGDYIIQGIFEGDNGELLYDRSEYVVGDKIKINIEDKQYEYEILANIRIKHQTLTTRSYGKYTYYLPTKAYLKVVESPVVMTYGFNSESGMEEELEKTLKKYTDEEEPMLKYESKSTYVEGFKGMKDMFNVVGTVMGLIIGLIGILNFFNSIFTSIWSRKHELAMLESMGMTKNQTIKMLSYEGICYSIYTIGAALVLGTACSVFIVKGIFGGLWFFDYQFDIMPILVLSPVIMIISLVIPRYVFKSVEKNSVVERLRVSQ